MGNLEIIDILCNVNSKLSKLVCRMVTEIEQANIADSVRENLRKEVEECTKMRDEAEKKLRRYHDG